LVAVVLAVLGAVVVAGLAGGSGGRLGHQAGGSAGWFGHQTGGLGFGHQIEGLGFAYHTEGLAVAGATPLGVLTAAGLLFFACAGYARLATLGEEVRNPRRTLRLAIPLALGAALLVYFVVALALLVGLGADRLAIEPAPLAALVAGTPWLVVVVRLG